VGSTRKAKTERKNGMSNARVLPCWRNQIVAALGCALEHCKLGCFCLLLGFFIFAGWCNKVRVSERARGPLIWYLDGRGANINVRLPRAKPMPPCERFYVANTGPWAPHNAPAPYKANESRRVHGGRRSPRQTGAVVTTGILECKQCSSCTLISIFYTPLFALQNIRVISIKCPLNLFSYLKSANRVTLIMRIYHTRDANRNCALTRDISADNWYRVRVVVISFGLNSRIMKFIKDCDANYRKYLT